MRTSVLNISLHQFEKAFTNTAKNRFFFAFPTNNFRKFLILLHKMSFQREEDRNTQENTVLSQDSCIDSLAEILPGIQTSLPDLSAASKTQTAAFQALHEDLLAQEDTGEETEGNDGASHTVDPNCVVTALLDSSEDGAIQPPGQESSDTEPKLTYLIA